MKEIREFINCELENMESFIKYAQKTCKKELKEIDMDEHVAKIEEWEKIAVRSIKDMKSECDGAIWFAYRIGMITNEQRSDLHRQMLDNYMDKISEVYEKI